MFIALWIISILLTGFLAAEKNRNAAGWIIFSIFTGPIALVFVALLPSLKNNPPTPPEYYGPEISGLSLKLQLEEIRREFQGITNKLNNLEVKINTLNNNEAPADSSAAKQPPSEVITPIHKPRPSEETLGQKIEPGPGYRENIFIRPENNKDLEINLGKFWLNKIGIVIFALGTSFLITYAFKYFGPLLRIAFGYAVCCALFFFGAHLEKKEKFVYFGRVLLAGAWPLCYFTTYAMYHFKASKIIFSQPLELILLSIVVAAMIWHSLRYKSEETTMTVFFIGYLTSTMGDISSFTLLSSLMLAIAALYLVYRMQWIRFIFLGIAFTYLTHLVWVVNHIGASPVSGGMFNVKNVYFLLNFGFLSIYWFLFTAAAHAITDQKQDAKLSAANFSNFLLYFSLTLPKIYVFYPQHKLNFVLGLGVIYLSLSALCEFTGRKKLFISDIVTAVALIALATSLKFTPYHTTLIWFIELPFLLFMGLVFRRPVYRYLSLGLAFILFFRIIFMDSYRLVHSAVFYKQFSWAEFFYITGTISMAISYALCRIGKKKFGTCREFDLGNFFSGFAVFYLVSFLFEFSSSRLLTFNISACALLILLSGALFTDRYLRFYSLLILLGAGLKFYFMDYYSVTGKTWGYPLIAAILALFYASYATYKTLKNKSLLEPEEENIPDMLFYGSTFLVVLSIFRYMPGTWISMSLGIAAIPLFALGFLLKDKTFRLGGFIIFAIILCRVIFVDLAELAIIYKIISFIILGCLFLGVSYFYTTLNTDKKDKSKWSPHG